MYKLRLASFILGFFLVALVAPQSQSPLVATGKGTLKGKYEISRDGNQYETYLGIRYGQIPRRFDASQPTDKWDGVKEAIEFGPHCAQQTMFGNGAELVGVEDCLFINVFTPKADNKKRGVMVYVHGGGGNVGDSTDGGGSFLVDEDIVLVTFNYRVGILGFLNTHDDEVHGNMGMKDMVLALKWTQENIEFFGGNKDRVTIYGISGGGAAVLYLMTSPMSQGLFNAVYSASGTPFSWWAFFEKNTEEATQVGAQLKCSTKNPGDLAKCLRDEPVESLLLARSSTKWNLETFPSRPTIEVKSARNPEPFLDETPEERFLKGNFKKVPVMLTMVPFEGVFYTTMLQVRGDEDLAKLNDDFLTVAPTLFGYGEDSKLKERKDEISKEVLAYYLKGYPISIASELNLAKIYTDTWFLRGIRKTAYILGTQTPVYVGLFAHDRRDYSIATGLFGVEKDLMVTHGDDLSYLFNPTGWPSIVPAIGELRNQDDIDFSKKFVKLVASFIETGVPKVGFGRKKMEWAPVTKEQIEADAVQWLNLDHDVFLYANLFEDRMQFWDNLYKPKKTEERDEL